MVIVGGTSHPVLVKKVAEELGCPWIISNTVKFQDQELKVQINQDLFGQDVILLQSTTKPANDHLMELLLLADTLKRSGCSRIRAVVPYFGYGRQDRPSYEYGPISASLVARMIEASGVDTVLTLDLHSKQSEGFFKIGVKNLDPTDLFISILKPEKNSVVVSPDIGGLSRARRLSEKLQTKLAIIHKNRNSHEDCMDLDMMGDVAQKDCILIDDIVDTGYTLWKAAKFLSQKGARSIKACVTHGVFSQGCLERIGQAGFDAFLITDSIFHQDLPLWITVVPISHFIAQAISRSCITP